MKTYLVGGAVRDKLLGITPKERDWVVVGSSPEEMIKKGFKQVGKDFPVFINPKNGEEYALARTERKSGRGYTGFEFNTDKSVSLEEDLKRRDLTINAIAEDDNGNLIDPYNGRQDILDKKLRHVSDAFSEDPLRVLRVARFKCNLPGFNIDEGTIRKIIEIKISGELDFLTGERVWMELIKSKNPYCFANTLEEFDILHLLPSCMNNLPGEFIPNLDSIKSMSTFMNDRIQDINLFCEKLRVPNQFKELAILLKTCKRDIISFSADTCNANELYGLIQKLDIRKKQRLSDFLDIMNAYEIDTGFIKHLVSCLISYKLDVTQRDKKPKDIKLIIKKDHLKIIQREIDNLNN